MRFSICRFCKHSPQCQFTYLLIFGDFSLVVVAHRGVPAQSLHLLTLQLKTVNLSLLVVSPTGSPSTAANFLRGVAELSISKLSRAISRSQRDLQQQQPNANEGPSTSSGGGGGGGGGGGAPYSPHPVHCMATDPTKIEQTAAPEFSGGRSGLSSLICSHIWQRSQ